MWFEIIVLDCALRIPPLHRTRCLALLWSEVGIGPHAITSQHSILFSCPCWIIATTPLNIQWSYEYRLLQAVVWNEQYTSSLVRITKCGRAVLLLDSYRYNRLRSEVCFVYRSITRLACLAMGSFNSLLVGFYLDHECRWKIVVDRMRRKTNIQYNVLGVMTIGLGTRRRPVLIFTFMPEVL